MNWKTVEEFDYQEGEILLIMDGDPKKQESYNGYKLRDDVVRCTTYYKDTYHRYFPDVTYWKGIWDENLTEKQISEKYFGGNLVKRSGNKITYWFLTRSKWKSIKGWIWKRDLIEDFCKTKAKK